MVKLLYIDLFCGAGGTSTGVEAAMYNGEKCAEVIACVNHDANAIASHAVNHPSALHFTEDIRTLELSPLVEHVEHKRAEYPGAKVVLWASLECTNFSKAKGGQPRDPDSRTLAEHLFRYIETIAPDYIQVENVEEFMAWGDLDDRGRPVSKERGRDYVKWCNRIQRYGYSYDYRLLTAADFGAYTTRRRYFGQFARKGLPLAWPQPGYGKIRRASSSSEKQTELLFPNSLKPWKPVREVLDLEDFGRSIFDRKKNLVDATLERIYAGLVRFVPVGNEHFLSKCYGGSPKWKNIALDEPAGTVTTVDHHAFISVHYGHGFNHSIEEPAKTLTTTDRFELVTPRFIDMQYGTGTAVSIDSPARTLTGNPKHNLVSCKQYLMNPQFQSAGRSINEPCFTLIARMDKRPPYMVTASAKADGVCLPSFIRWDGNRLVYEIYATDSPIMIKIKEFMAAHSLVDVMMRMLRIPELLQIMGFPADYVLVGTQKDRKKYIGNAVEVNMARVLCEALYMRLMELEANPVLTKEAA